MFWIFQRPKRAQAAFSGLTQRKTYNGMPQKSVSEEFEDT